MTERMIDVEILTLNTVNVLRKYIAFADVNLTFADEWQAFRINAFEAYMTLAQHTTQLVWFRKLFIIFSRYTYVNSFTRYVQTDAAKKSINTEDEDDVDRVVDESGNGSKKKKTKVNID